MKRRVICLLMSFGLLISSASCDKKAKETEKEEEVVPGCVEATEEILDALISCDSKSLKMLGGFTSAHSDTVDAMAETPEIRKAIKKSYYEIDEDSVIEKKSRASVEVDVKVPDYSSIVAEMEIVPERFFSDFYNAVDKQDKKEYKTVILEMNYKIEDEEYILTNPDEIIVKLYTPISDALQESVDKIPDDYGQREDGLFTFSNLKKVDLNVDRFITVLKATDAAAADTLQDGNIDATSPFTLYKTAYIDHVMYLYAEFATVEECKENSETLSYMAKSGGSFYHFEDDWGCSLWQFEGTTMLVYYSDKAQIMLSSTDGSEEGEKLINDYIEELTTADFAANTSQTSAGLSIQEFRTILSNEGYIVFDGTELRDNVIEQVFATTSDSSIVFSYEVFKDKDSAYKEFEDWKRSVEEGKNSGQVDDLISDSNKIQARFDDTYTILIVCEDAVITALGQPDSDENIALVDKTISSLGF